MDKDKAKCSEKKRTPIAFIISLVFIFGLLVGVVWLVIPELIEAIKVIIQGVIGFINRIAARADAHKKVLNRISWASV